MNDIAESGSDVEHDRTLISFRIVDLLLRRGLKNEQTKRQSRRKGREKINREEMRTYRNSVFPQERREDVVIAEELLGGFVRIR